jgi:hypothetical protein
MERSRREVLRAGGALLAASGVAGCIEERVTLRETRVTDSSSWMLSPDNGNRLEEQAFDDYVDRMADRYGDSGVYGLGADRPDGFEVAYAQRYAITRETPGSPTDSEFSLAPETVDPEAPVLIADACVAGYDLGNGRYRYWLWVAADPTDGRLVRDVRLTALSTGVRLNSGTLADASDPSVDDGVASVGLEHAPSGTFPVHGGTIGTTTVREVGGTYVTEWTGELEEPQSANGVCEVERDGAYDLFWTMSLGYSFEETV